MKTPLPRDERALTLLELLFVIVIIVTLAAMFLPALAKAKRMSSPISCVNNLKQIGLSYRQWALDNNGSLPMTVSTANAGAMEYVGDPEATWRIFGCMSNVLNTPKILFCPFESDSKRAQADSFGSSSTSSQNVFYSSNTNLSYFVGVDANQTLPGMILAGDHNIGEPKPTFWNVAVASAYSDTSTTSLQALGTNLTSIKAAWTDGNHKMKGNLALADGSVHQTSTLELGLALANSGDPGRTNVLGNWHGAPPWQNRLQFPALP